MTTKTRLLNTPSKRLAWATAFAVAACIALSVSSFAQGGGAASGGRLNPVIARFEQGKPAFSMESWQLFGIEHNPFIIFTMEKGFAALRPEGSTHPRLAPF